MRSHGRCSDNVGMQMKYDEYDVTDRVQYADTKEVHTFLWLISP
jgi:hypothetical protein